MKLYHATTQAGYEGIVSSGKIKTGYDGVVYLADSVDNALKFVAIRHIGEILYILEIDIPDEANISESFDHNEAFFKCKAYTYPYSIHGSHITNIWVSTPKEDK